MDERLIAAGPRFVMRQMAEAYLATPVVTAQQGEIRLAPHQVDAASRLLALLGESGGAVLADATGLGKTFVAIAVARVIGPALVIAPASLRRMWRESLGRAGVDARVTSYEGLSRGSDVGVRPALLVLDEAHHARNPRAKRYGALADLAWGAQVLLLTATPIHNRGRDLRALIALFAGSRAHTMNEDELRRLVVRRTAGAWGTIGTAGGGSALPAVGEPKWLAVPTDRDTLRAITALPPAVATADGATAHSLLLLGLIRAWSSSEAALRATLRRRLRRAASFDAALESGRVPDRRDLASWPVVDDAIQLGFPSLLVSGTAAADVAEIRATLDRHIDGVRCIIRTLDRTDGATDKARMSRLASIRERHPSTPVVAFTQFADTATATFDACARKGGVALVTGRGARIASGRVTVDEIVRGFDNIERGDRTNAMPLDLLVATDVLSEGLSLRRAGVIVHLDLPWTVARLEQRVGRLRRFGSKYRRIEMYAIGPPVGARELLPVVRALQRKARLASSIAGLEETQSALPLFGERLTKSTAVIMQRGESQAVEEIRRTLASWIGPVADERSLELIPGEHDFVALALICRGPGPQLLAINDLEVSESPADILRAVRTLSSKLEPVTHAGVEDPSAGSVAAAADVVEKWLSEDRGREMVKPATDAPSAAHVAVLRALQEILSSTTRSDRSAVSKRIERCRQLVISARGIGAEMALTRLVDSSDPLGLDALESLLQSRASGPDATQSHTRLVAMLAVGTEAGSVQAYVPADSIGDLPHPDRPRSSIRRAAPGAARE